MFKEHKSFSSGHMMAGAIIRVVINAESVASKQAPAKTLSVNLPFSAVCILRGGIVSRRGQPRVVSFYIGD